MSNGIKRETIWVSVLLLAALIVRLGYVAHVGPQAALPEGGDSRWYLVNGQALYGDTLVGTIREVNYDISVIPTAPLYLFFVGFWQSSLPFEPAATVIQVLQALAGTATCGLIVVMGRRVSRDWRVGWLAAAAFAFFPPAIREISVILTEPLYVFFIVAGLMAYLLALPGDTQKNLSWRWLLVAAVGIGLATLTRAVALLFPLGLAFHLVVIVRAGRWQRRAAQAALLLLVYSAVVGTWTVYNLVRFDRFVIGSNQMTGTFWRGAVTDDGSPWHNDRLLAGEDPLDQAVTIIQSDPINYVRNRLLELGGAFAQPHGVIHLGAETPMRQLAADWIRGGFRWADLQRLITADGFWIQAWTYLLHYTGLMCGLMGMVITRRHWRTTTPLIGFVAYTTLLHLVLLALPRYLYPMYPVWWIFAAWALLIGWDGVRRRSRLRPGDQSA